jgi:hypothetical protein
VKQAVPGTATAAKLKGEGFFTPGGSAAAAPKAAPKLISFFKPKESTGDSPPDAAAEPGASDASSAGGPQVASVSFGIGDREHDQEGRSITIEYADFFVVALYVPNSGQKASFMQTTSRSLVLTLTLCFSWSASSIVLTAGTRLSKGRYPI